MLQDDLVETLRELGAPVRLPAGDDILCADLDLLRDLKPRARSAALRKAKREALRQYLDDEVDLIRRVAADEDNGDVAVLLGGFVPSHFEGRNERLTPPSHATLSLQFYGAPLSARDIRRWTKLAHGAAKPLAAADRVSASPVIYFISIVNVATVKIGFSANFAHRLRSLRTASPVEPTVHLTIPGSKQLESELHRRFQLDHIRREWFHFSAQIAAFVEQHQGSG